MATQWETDNSRREQMRISRVYMGPRPPRPYRVTRRSLWLVTHYS